MENFTLVGERLKHFAKVKFGGPSRMENAYKGKSSLKPYYAGKSRPGGPILDILQANGCNINWLLKGEGEMLTTSTATTVGVVAGATASNRVLRHYQVKRLYEYAELKGIWSRKDLAVHLKITEDQLLDYQAGNKDLRELEEVIKNEKWDYHFIYFGSTKKEQSSEIREFIRYPVVASVRAGNDTWYYNEEGITEFFPYEYERQAGVYLVKIYGESMLDKEDPQRSILPGSYALIDETKSDPAPNDIVIVQLGQNLMLKQYIIEHIGKRKQIFLRSYNKDFGDIPINEQDNPVIKAVTEIIPPKRKLK